MEASVDLRGVLARVSPYIEVTPARGELTGR